MARRGRPKKINTEQVDELGEEVHSIKADKEKQYASIIVTWIDDRGKTKNMKYSMADLTINENTTEEYKGAHKKTHIHLSLDGTVVERLSV